MVNHFLQYDVQPSVREIRCPVCTGAVERWPPETVYLTHPPQYPYRCKSCGHTFTSTFENEILYRPIPGTEKIVTIGDNPKNSNNGDYPKNSNNDDITVM